MRPNESAERAREAIDVPWDDLRGARVQKAVVAGLRARRSAAHPRRRWVVLAAVAAAFTLAVALFFVISGPKNTRASLEFADGSFVVANADARLAPEVVLPQTIQVRQTGGIASYEVTPHPERRFVVWVGDVRIEVLGTGFRVERLEAAVRVVVSHGKVRVTRGERTVVLVAGDEVTLGDEDPSPPSPTASEAPSSQAPVLSPAPTASEVATPETSASSAEGEPTAAELFRRADAARQGGQPDEAVRLLRQLVQSYPKDGRVTLAVFTIGRVEAQRRNYAEAAAAFESCGAALSGEALAEAALARSAAGQPGRAKALAKQYLDRFPAGPRSSELTRLAE